jgi:hypothetical protein
MDRIAVGLDNGEVHMYKVEGYIPSVTYTTTIVESLTTTRYITITEFLTSTATKTTTSYITATLTVTVEKVVTVPTVIKKEITTIKVVPYFITVAPSPGLQGVKVPSDLLSLYNETRYDLLAPKAIYDELGSASGPLADSIKTEMKNQVQIIAEMVNVADMLQNFLNYYKKYLVMKQQAEELLHQQFNYNVIYKLYMLVQNMKVTLTMANNVLKSIEKQFNKLILNKPPVDLEMVRRVVGDPRDFLVLATGNLTIEEVSPVNAKLNKIGGERALVNALIVEHLDKAYKAFKKLEEVWERLYEEGMAEINSYESYLGYYVKG